MMRLRLGGLAVMCMLATLAVWGAGTASATRLCSMEAEICPEAKRWGATHPITGEVSAPFQIATAGGNMNCSKSKIAGELLNAGGGPGIAVAAEITSITFAGCSIGGTACTVMADLGAPYFVQFAWTTKSNGTMEISPGWEFVCGFKLSCIFSAPGSKLTVTGGGAAEIGASGLVLSRQGPICTTSAKLNAIYILSSPGPMFMTEK